MWNVGPMASTGQVCASHPKLRGGCGGGRGNLPDVVWLLCGMLYCEAAWAKSFVPVIACLIS